MQNFVALKPQTSNIHGSSMNESIFTIQASFDSTISVESVLLIKVHVESQIEVGKHIYKASKRERQKG